MKRLEFNELSEWLIALIEDSNDFVEGEIIDIEDFYSPGKKDIETGIFITFKSGQKLKITIEEA